MQQRGQGRVGGGWWAALRARLGLGPGASRAGRVPLVRRRWNTLELQFEQGVSQSRMLASDPDHLLIDYTRTMMGALLIRPSPSRVGIVGLGGGSQAKFCYRELPGARIEAIEVNPEVVGLRRRFRVPDDDGRFRVVTGDASRLLPDRVAAYDLLLVDAYDETGIPDALGTPAWYLACRASLADGGVAAFNLYGPDRDRHVAMLRGAFGQRLVVLEEPRQSNRIAFGWRGDPLPAGRLDRLRPPTSLSRRAQASLEPAFARFGRALQAARDATGGAG